MSYHRWKRNFSLFWCLLFLLQEFRIVLLLHIENMKADTLGMRGGQSEHANTGSGSVNSRDLTSTRKKKLSDKAIHQVNIEQAHKQAKRSTDRDTDVQRVLDATDVAVDTLLKQNSSLRDRLKGMNGECNYQEDEKVREFWKSQGPAYPLYLVSSVIEMRLISCDDILELNIRELLELMETDEIIELIEASGELATAIDDHVKAMKNTTTDQGKLQVEPESFENEIADEIVAITSTNAQRVQALSEVFYSLNSSQARNISGIEDELDATINEYETISSMLLDDSVSNFRQKRSLGEKRTKTIMKDVSLSLSMAKPKFTRAIIENTAIAARLGYHRMTSRAKGPENRNLRRVADAFDSYSSRVGARIRRNADVVDGTMVIIKHESYPCKILSVFDGVLQFRNFFESSIRNQLWIWQNGTLKNVEKMSYLYIDRVGTPAHLSSRPSSYRLRKDHYFTIRDSRHCSLSVDGPATNISLSQKCTSADLKWQVIPFVKSQFPLSEIACYFLIQDIETCKVVTVDDTSNRSLTLKSIDENIILNQLWYKDDDYIRNRKSNTYLTSGLAKSQVMLADRNNDVNQRWIFQNGTLMAKELYGDVGLATQDTRIVVDYISDKHGKWNLTDANEDDVRRCALERQFFVIKHSDFPCKILCSKNMTSSLPQTKTVHNDVPVVSNLLHTENVYEGVYFGEFDITDSANCLWYSYENNIRNA